MALVSPAGPFATEAEVEAAAAHGKGIAHDIQCIPEPPEVRAAREAEIEAMRAQKDAAYEERNRVVAALARLFPSGLKRTDIPGWDAEWHGCVYIDTPAGQLSWHFHDSQAHLFDGLPPYFGEWDGHDTPEKYRRLAAITGAAREAEVEMMREARLALLGMLAHSCVSDAGGDMKDEEDHAAERMARALLVRIEERMR